MLCSPAPDASPVILCRLLGHLSAKQEEFAPRDRGAVLRGLAILDLHGSALLRSITRHPSQWRNYHPRHVPSVLWALGKLSHTPPRPVVDILLGHTQASRRTARLFAFPGVPAATLALC